ncbi:MAG: hypothetical protein JWQ04_966 [Pedosphaera sp.]|nr:hypothetical protein [Pedosphaera sp.]
MKLSSRLALFAAISLLVLAQSEAQPRGGLIGGAIATNSTAIGPVPSPANTNAAPAIHTNAAGYYLIGFDELAGYTITLTEELKHNTNRAAWADAQINAMIPPAIKAYDGKKVVIEGFMLPVSFDNKGKMTGFILMKNQMSCCYGGPSQLHEFVTVRLGEPMGDPDMDYTVNVRGVLHVGAERENGELVGIYRLNAEKAGK